MNKGSHDKDFADYYENEEFFDKHIFPHFIDECNKRGHTFSKEKGHYFILFKKNNPVKILVEDGEIEKYYNHDRSGLRWVPEHPSGTKTPWNYYIEGALAGYSYLDIRFDEYSLAHSWDLKEFLRSIPKGDQPPIKVSMALEKQKIKFDAPRQLTFDDLKKDKEVGPGIEEHAIEVIGLDLDTGGHSIVTALQTLLSNEIRKVTSPKNKDNYCTLEVSKSQFFDACGVGKSMTGRGKMEYNKNESDVAMKNLRALRDRKFLLIYQEMDNNGKKRLVKTVRSLINVDESYDEPSSREIDEIRKDGSPVRPLGKLRIHLHSLFTMGWESKFILKPANYLQEIELASGANRPSRYEINFIDYLFITYRDTAANQGKPCKEIGYRLLAERLRMDGFIQKRQWKRIKDKLRDCCELAKKLGYLNDYQIETINAEGYEEKVVMELNIDKLGEYDEKGRKRVRVEAPGH